jgi:5-methylcytosine-specific restriction endonuclease McrA
MQKTTLILLGIVVGVKIMEIFNKIYDSHQVMGILYPNIWELIEKQHDKCREATKKKLYKNTVVKISMWSKDNNTTKEEIEALIIRFIGKKCLYCLDILDFKNMSLDHDVPKSKDGKRELGNLFIICKRCNIRKGDMSRLNYLRLLEFLKDIDEEDRKYVLQKLNSSPKGYYKFNKK